MIRRLRWKMVAAMMLVVALVLGVACALFDRFYRLDPARTGPDGYGLGLPIAKSLTRAMKGKIWMRSQQGVVSFFVRLPLDR